MTDLSKAIKLFAQLDFRSEPQSTLSIELALVDCSLSTAEKPQKVVPVEKATKAAVIETNEPGPEHIAQQQEAADLEVPASVEAPTTEVARAAIPQPPQSIEQIRQHWNEFVNSCRGMGSSGNLDALLRSACEAVALEGDTLVLGFYWDFQRAKVEDSKYRHLVEKKLQDVFGVPYHVRCILTPRNKTPKTEQQAHNPLVNEAVKMGAKIIEEEPNE